MKPGGRQRDRERADSERGIDLYKTVCRPRARVAKVSAIVTSGHQSPRPYGTPALFPHCHHFSHLLMLYVPPSDTDRSDAEEA